MKYLLFLSVFLIACLGLGSLAHAQIKDSYYFMADDGVQDEDEMQEEAMYVHDMCSSNIYKSAYYSCECVAGAFLQKREEMGGIMPQQEIVDRIYRGGLGECANTIQIAGDMYESCQSYAKLYREYEPDNEEFCTCAANTFALSFTKNPYLRTKYIENLKTDALVNCEERDSHGRPLKGQ